MKLRDLLCTKDRAEGNVNEICELMRGDDRL